MRAVTRYAAEGVLMRCLVEGDESAKACARRARRKALLGSLALQFALAVALLLLPMLTAGDRLRPRSFALIPPYRGVPAANRHPGAAPSKRHNIARYDPARPVYQPLRVPTHAASGDTEENASRNGDVGPELPGVSGMPSVGLSDPHDFVRPTVVPAEPQRERTQQRLKRSEGVQQALLIHRVEPRYPTIAIQMRLEGTVRLRAIIGRHGAVSSVEVWSGHPILAQAARDAVAQWHYRPVLLNGEPVEVETLITVIFQLRR